RPRIGRPSWISSTPEAVSWETAHGKVLETDMEEPDANQDFLRRFAEQRRKAYATAEAPAGPIEAPGQEREGAERALRTPKMGKRAWWKLPLFLLVVGTLGYSALGPFFAERAESQPPLVNCYGFSILEEVLERGIFPAFQREWEQKNGEAIHFVGN